MKYLVFGLGLAVGLFLILSDPSPDTGGDTSKKLRTVGSAAKPFNRLYVRRKGQLKEIRVTRQMPIYDLDTWETGDNGIGSLRFNNGAVIAIQSNSRLIIDDFVEEKKIEVTVLQGEVEYIRKVSKDQFEIIRNPVGGISSPTSEVIIKLPAQPTPTPQTITDTSPTATPIPKPTPPRLLPPRPTEPKGSLSSEYIKKEISGQKRFFQRCYLKYFNRKKGQVELGVVTMAFIIEPTGRVTRANVLSTEIQDKKYQNCVSQVIERTRFRSFNAQPIEVEYPIEVSLPQQ